MHTRKTFIVYPPDYVPGSGFKTAHSRRQAWKTARRMGVGASVFVQIDKHKAKRTQWVGSQMRPLWDVCRYGE